MRCLLQRKKRAGFTLVELLIVIAIIAVLAALVTAGVMKALENIPLLSTVNEISQMSLGLEQFKQKYGGVYPPSKIVLPPTADAASQTYISAIWPRIDFALCTWGNSGTVTLEGDQCLVYFLRGPTGDGWSLNPRNPTSAKATATETRGGPFFQFPENRLFDRAGNGFRAFADPYATPARRNYYAFFSSYRRPNGYVVTDCASLGVSPYYQTGSNPRRYYNPNSFQIISAGKNFLFGAGGGTWPGGPQDDYANEVAKGFDDLSNFHGGVLGAP